MSMCMIAAMPMCTFMVMHRARMQLYEVDRHHLLCHQSPPADKAAALLAGLNQI